MPSPRRALLAALIFFASGCNSTNEPRNRFVLCVHEEGVPFVPGSTGTACVQTPNLRAGESVIVELEADNYFGPDRIATLSTPFGKPTGWTVTFADSMVEVPGKESITVTVPTNASPGDYPLLVRGSVAGGEVSEVVFAVRVIGFQ